MLVVQLPNLDSNPILSRQLACNCDNVSAGLVGGHLHLLGRQPRGRFDIVVRDAAGDPVVIRDAPLLDDGTPMPTLYWLVTCSAADAVDNSVVTA